MNNNKINTIVEIIEDKFNDVNIISIWNCMAGHSNGRYSMIYIMERIDEVLEMLKPSDIIAAVYKNNDFCFGDTYFMYGKTIGLKSFNVVTSDEINMDILAEYLMTEMPDILMKYNDSLIKGFIASYNFFNPDAAQHVISTLNAFGHINLIKDDWDKLVELVRNLLHEN